MPVKQDPVHLLQRTLDRHDLIDDIDAIAVVLNHALNAPHVSLDAFQASKEVVAVLVSHEILIL